MTTSRYNYPVLVGWILLGLHVAIAISVFNRFTGVVDANGVPLGADFITYWAASHLGLAGTPAAAYDAARLLAAEELVGPIIMRHTGWYYPPTFLLFVMPLALLPYVTAYIAFATVTAMACLAALRRFVIEPAQLVLVLAFPGIFANVTNGQNGMLTVTFGALALYWLRSRPVLAGIMLGLLCIKPHLALLFPLALVLIRAWQAFFAAVITTLALSLTSLWLFGADTWLAFFDGMGTARHYLETDIPLDRMPTVFAAFRQAGAALPAAYATHAAMAAVAIFAMIRLWRSAADFRLKASGLVAATLLVSPYLFDYDLIWHAIPIFWLWACARETRWLPGEKIMLVLAWLSLLYVPLIMRLLTGQTIQIGALVSACLLLLVMRRARFMPTGLTMSKTTS